MENIINTKYSQTQHIVLVSFIGYVFSGGKDLNEAHLIHRFGNKAA